MVEQRRRVLALALALSAGGIVGGCATSPPDRSELLSESYHLIDRYYVKPVQTSSIGEASLHALTKLDQNLTVDADGHDLVLKYGTRPIALFPEPAPDPNDWRRWGDTAARVTAAAASASRPIAALPESALDRSLLDGAIGTLDQYSRYLPPGASDDTLVEEDRVDAGAATVGAMPAARLAHSPSVELGIDGHTAIVRIRRFTASTGALLRQRLARVFDAGGIAPRGIILDLRDNPGGQLAAAVDVADLFLDRGTIVTLEGRDPRDYRVFSAALDRTVYETIPLVVLINGGSTSAAEVLAAAIQGNGRGVVIGSSSFGKGTAQRIIPLANGGELWITSSYMRAPAGYLLQHHGVVPDVCTRLSWSDLQTARASGRAPRLERFRELVQKDRGTLSEAQWLELRLACPPWAVHSVLAGDAELDIAEHLVRYVTEQQP